LRFWQTSQNQVPLVIRRLNDDIQWHAILHRGEFARRECLEQVSGTCARKEGLRTLTSPRREASLFKLGRTLGFGQFLLRATRFRDLLACTTFGRPMTLHSVDLVATALAFSRIASLNV
jgi:hypothetical protein